MVPTCPQLRPNHVSRTAWSLRDFSANAACKVAVAKTNNSVGVYLQYWPEMYGSIMTAFGGELSHYRTCPGTSI